MKFEKIRFSIELTTKKVYFIDVANVKFFPFDFGLLFHIGIKGLMFLNIRNIF
jgi:hypothetical protein